MYYKKDYLSPIGKILLEADENYLVGLYFENEDPNFICHEGIAEPIKKAERWLDEYYSRKVPTLKIPIRMIGTPFQRVVWETLLEIKYGETVSYTDITDKVKIKLNKERMSAQAIGNAISRNPISIIVPCHRVVGKNGSLTGYRGGIGNKVKLLEIEGVDTKRFFFPKKK